MRPIVLAAQPSDARLIADALRKNSIKEVERVGPKKAALIEEAIRRAQFSWTGWADGQVACIWGLQTNTFLDDKATLWLVSTPLVEKHAFTFVRQSQIFIRDLIKQRFTLIHGIVDTDFDRSVRWLHWLGFKINAAEHGLRYFHMKRT